MEKICDVCNNKFNTIFSGQKRCSVECQKIIEKNRCKEWMKGYYVLKQKKQKNCEICNKNFIASREWQKTCSKECKKINRNLWYNKNIEHIKKLKKIRDDKNRDKIRQKNIIFYNKNKEKYSEGHKLWRLKNIDKLRNIRREQYKNDIKYKLGINLGNRVRIALKKDIKKGHTLELIGCTIQQLKEHLESQFKPGMNWQNHGMKGWHIDHITPCAAFNLSNKEEQYKCFHYTNLQPLWWYENLSKNDKIILNNKILVEVQ